MATEEFPNETNHAAIAKAAFAEYDKPLREEGVLSIVGACCNHHRFFGIWKNNSLERAAARPCVFGNSGAYK
ncbi:MAG: hypothetical protein AAGM38_18165 [Pseudomonadota bacterium]